MFDLFQWLNAILVFFVKTELPEVVHVIQDRFYELQTTRTWDYLKHTSKHPKNLLNQTNMGDKVIIGVVDSGIFIKPNSYLINHFFIRFQTC